MVASCGNEPQPRGGARLLHLYSHTLEARRRPGYRVVNERRDDESQVGFAGGEPPLQFERVQQPGAWMSAGPETPTASATTGPTWTATLTWKR